MSTANLKNSKIFISLISNLQGEIKNSFSSQKINKKIIESNKGNFPVYSGSTENKGLMGYIDYFDYDGHYLRIITVGNAGETTELEGKFSLAQNNGVLIPKDTEIEKYISFKYLKYIL